jgi:hypothetical protein
MRWHKNNSRKRVEELVFRLESGGKIGEVLAEMKISLTQARRMLERPMGRKVIQEVRELRALPRDLATGKKAEAAGGEVEEEVTAGMTEEEMEAVLKESTDALAEEARERYAS